MHSPSDCDDLENNFLVFFPSFKNLFCCLCIAAAKNPLHRHCTLHMPNSSSAEALKVDCRARKMSDIRQLSLT